MKDKTSNTHTRQDKARRDSTRENKLVRCTVADELLQVLSGASVFRPSPRGEVLLRAPKECVDLRLDLSNDWAEYLGLIIIRSNQLGRPVRSIVSTVGPKTKLDQFAATTSDPAI